MHRTGIEDYYIIKDNKKMRFGYTTGSCATAAAKGAALMLLSGEQVESVPLMTPKGIPLDLELLEITRTPESVRCAVRKDGGDDPDATHGTLIFAEVTRVPVPDDAERPYLEVDGGVGVGRVTKPGLQQAVGEAAINPTPMKMIRENLLAICEEFEYKGGLRAVISVPEGEEIAKKTFNPRLGIVGGISILGTSGIVEPMSEASLIASIKLEMSMLRSKGYEYLIISPGNYGETYLKEHMDCDISAAMQCSNYVGETLDMAVNMGVKGILFVSHVGKFVKVAGGIMNTHSKCSDSRAELMAAFALRAGADRETAMKILDSITTDEALGYMEEAGVRHRAMELTAEKIRFYLQHRTGGRIETEAVIFSGVNGFEAMTEGAEEMLKRFRRKGEEI